MMHIIYQRQLLCRTIRQTKSVRSLHGEELKTISTALRSEESNLYATWHATSCDEPRRSMKRDSTLSLPEGVAQLSVAEIGCPGTDRSLPTSRCPATVSRLSDRSTAAAAAVSQPNVPRGLTGRHGRVAAPLRQRRGCYGDGWVQGQNNSSSAPSTAPLNASKRQASIETLNAMARRGFGGRARRAPCARASDDACAARKRAERAVLPSLAPAGPKGFPEACRKKLQLALTRHPLKSSNF